MIFTLDILINFIGILFNLFFYFFYKLNNIIKFNI